jgi:aspartate aminotransferase
MIRLADALPVIIPGRIDTGFRLDCDLIRRSISPMTKALIINSPGNPSGLVASREELEELASLVHESGIFVLSDEIYEKIVYDGCTHHSIGSWETIRERVITINGLSKAYAMTGWRIGYLGGPADVVKAAAKVQSQTTSNPNSVAQKAALEALTGDQNDIVLMRNEFERRRNIALKTLAGAPEINPVKPQGAFYILIGIRNLLGKKANGVTIKGSSDLAEFLLEQWKVAVVPGIAFGVDGCIRMSYACSPHDLQQGLERMIDGFCSLKN